MDTKISNQIRKLRKLKGFKSAQSLANALGVHLKTVQGWENETNPNLPDLDNLLALCNLFECDLDYLTGRMEAPTHEIEYIREKTGLSIGAILKIKKLKGTGYDEFLSRLVEHEDSESLLRKIHTASDDREIWWDGLWRIPIHTDHPDKYEGVADYLATSSLAGVISDLRLVNREPDETRFYNVDPQMIKEYDRRERISAMIERCETAEDLRREMEKEDSFTEEDRETIRTIWAKSASGRENIGDLSYMEWSRRYGKRNDQQEQHPLPGVQQETDSVRGSR